MDCIHKNTQTEGLANLAESLRRINEKHDLERATDLVSQSLLPRSLGSPGWHTELTQKVLAETYMSSGLRSVLARFDWDEAYGWLLVDSMDLLKLIVALADAQSEHEQWRASLKKMYIERCRSGYVNGSSESASRLSDKKVRSLFENDAPRRAPPVGLRTPEPKQLRTSNSPASSSDSLPASSEATSPTQSATPGSASPPNQAESQLVPWQSPEPAPPRGICASNVITNFRFVSCTSHETIHEHNLRINT